MAEKLIYQPHDGLIKYSFGQTRNAASVFEGHLPEALVRPMDWSTMEVVPGSFVDPSLSAHHTDILYKVSHKGKPVLLYNLQELAMEKIRGTVAAWLTLTLMKASAEDTTSQWLEKAAPLLNLLQQDEATGMFEALLRYFFRVDNTMTPQKVLHTLRHFAAAQFTNQAMSIADQLREEGLKEGREQGKLTLRILDLQALLGFPQSLESELLAKSTEELRQLLGELRAREASR